MNLFYKLFGGITFCTTFTIVMSKVHTKETLYKLKRVTKKGCWNFTGPISKGCGYGKVGFYGKVINAHRLSWILTNGDVPSGLIVCHKCDNRKCINPDHLFIGTYRDNTQDMIRKGRRKARTKTYVIGNLCRRGHLLTMASLGDSSGLRYCRICRAQYSLNRYYKSKK